MCLHRIRRLDAAEIVGTAMNIAAVIMGLIDEAVHAKQGEAAHRRTNSARVGIVETPVGNCTAAGRNRDRSQSAARPSASKPRRCS